MKTFVSVLPLVLMMFFSGSIVANLPEKEIPKLDNPMSSQYLKKKLRKSQPRLVLNASVEKNLKQKLNSDPVVQNLYRAIRLNADNIMEEPLLERQVIGRRLLAVSREMLYRINMLGMVYRIEEDKQVLQRINDEVTAVCKFSDWNPSHFLDVAEMAMAIALALDWTAGDLPGETIKLAKNALVEKGLNPAWPEGNTPGWVYDTNNWNQVCNGGMIAASIAVAEDHPELAAKTIERALEGLPHSLAEYMPDGVYPEGSTYWSYGTSFSVATIAMLESALGNDFGYASYPGFMESAVFRKLSVAPSDFYYNFADCGDKRNDDGDITLAWFATKTGNAEFFETDRFLKPAESMGKLSRLSGAALVWISQFEPKESVPVPAAWKGEGSNPVVIFTSGNNDPHHYYFGGKGGRGMVNHGNMDGGSFIFELNGVRWAIDPGNQEYHDLEKTGFDLWGRCQDCERWTLLTKNNYGHSTVTINDQLHRTEGLVTLKSFRDGEKPEATFDMSATLGGLVSSATRRFVKDSQVSVLIEDVIGISDSTRLITWQLMTTADVEITPGGAVLKQDGKELQVQNLSHPDYRLSVVSLDPAPLKLDRQIENLKRIELRIPAWTVDGDVETIRVRLSGE